MTQFAECNNEPKSVSLLQSVPDQKPIVSGSTQTQSIKSPAIAR